MKLRFVLLFIIPAFAFLNAETKGGYEFIVNGVSEEPYTLTTEGDAPVPGDVVFIENIPICLDAPGNYTFETKNGVVRRVYEDGHKSVVGCTIKKKFDRNPFSADPNNSSQDSENSKDEVINPLANLDDKDLKALRGITLDAWPSGIEKLLARLDLAHVCIELDSGVLNKLPDLPEETRVLILNSHGSWDCSDVSGFKRLKNLRFLSLRSASPKSFDFSVLNGLPLEYLSLPSIEKTENVESIGKLRTLKTLDASYYCSYLGDLRWMSKLENLRQVFAYFAISRTEGDSATLDLASLGKLPHLAVIHADGSAIKTLPTAHMPALQVATLLLGGASSEMIDSFRKANPNAEITYDMNAALAARLLKADRLKARTGGTCHRDKKKEKVIYETRKASEIAEFTRHLTIDESQSNGCCMCCGNPTFEFYQGEKCIAMVGFHHGRSLRWADGIWPVDGLLIPSCADYLVEWLAKHGDAEPQKELRECRLQEEAANRRWKIYEALLPEKVNQALKSASTPEEATAAFEKNLPDAKARAALYLRLYGCDNAAWNLTAEMDQPLAETWIPSIPEKILHDVIAESGNDTKEARGAIRWVFGLAHANDLKEEPKLLDRLVRLALTDPRQSNRWRTLAVIRDLRTPQAIELLRETMKNGTTPQKVDEETTIEPGGMVTFFPNSITLPEGTSDQAAAALCLSMIGDKETEAEVKRIRDSLSAEARKCWDECLKKTEQ